MTNYTPFRAAAALNRGVLSASAAGDWVGASPSGTITETLKSSSPGGTAVNETYIYCRDDETDHARGRHRQ